MKKRTFVIIFMGLKPRLLQAQYCLFMFLLLPASVLKCQDLFDTYDADINDQTYNIEISTKKGGKFDLYIDAFPLDRLYDKGGIIVNQLYHPGFIRALNEAKEKYTEWVKTAKENDVTDLRKIMDIKCKAGGYFYSGSRWHYQSSVTIRFEFVITEPAKETRYFLFVKTPELKSSSNQYTTARGFLIAFASENQITELVDKISIENIKKYESSPKKEELFKN